MAVIYLRHPIHGEKVASTDVEAAHDRENGWEDFDPTAKEVAPAASAPLTPVEDKPDPEQKEPAAPPAPDVPSFLAPVESDLPTDFPGRSDLIAAGYTTWESVVELTRDQLIAVKGIGPKTADAILEVMEG